LFEHVEYIKKENMFHGFSTTLLCVIEQAPSHSLSAFICSRSHVFVGIRIESSSLIFIVIVVMSESIARVLAFLSF